MLPLILTGWTSGTEWDRIGRHTMPLVIDYAKRHGFALSWADLHGPRPPSWQKIIGLLAKLRHHETVLWIDADVVIEDASRSILDDVPADAWQALCEHHTECGTVPNCGVWVVRQPMAPVLQAAWDCGRHITHPWWEQAVMLEQMGYAVEGNHARLAGPTPLHGKTAWLSSEWNDHPSDTRRSAHVRFRHVTSYPGRLGKIEECVAQCKQKSA